jgi:TolB-like protein
MSLFAELKRRNVIRVGIAYIVSAWLFAQVFEMATDAFEAPTWVLKVVITLLMMGAVPVLVFSWVYEMTSEGLRRESDLVDSGGPRSRTGGRLNIIVTVLLLVAIGLFLGQRFWPTSEPQTQMGTETVVGEVQGAALGPKSIAVLPFENFSDSTDDAHFSDGLADTVLHRLAQLDDLTVIARNSSFVYKGSNVDIRTVGEDLGVANVLEGSVQRQGDRLRVIAQLIESATGSHLWSATFDRPMSDIFSIQDEIAASVAEALQVELLGEERERLTRSGTTDEIAWALYLAANAAFEEQGMEGRFEARDLLIQAINRDPSFVEAYLDLGRMYDFIGWHASGFEERTEALENGFESVGRAIALDPNNPKNLKVLGQLRRRNNQTMESLALLEAYLEKSPSDSEAHMMVGLALHSSGQAASAYQSFVQAHRLDPKAPILLRQLGFSSVGAGEVERGIQWYRRAISENPDWGVFSSDLSGVYSNTLGQWDLALAEVREAITIDSPGHLERFVEILLAVDLIEQADWAVELIDLDSNEHSRAERLRMLRGLVDPRDTTAIDLEMVKLTGGELGFRNDNEFMGWYCLASRDFECALQALRPEAQGLTSEFSRSPFFESARATSLAARWGLAELKAGDSETGRLVLESVLDRIRDAPLQGASCGPICGRANAEAELLSALGETDAALTALEASLPEDGSSFINSGLIRSTPIENSAYLEPLAQQPRFIEFVAELKRRRLTMAEKIKPVADQIIEELSQ